MNGSWGYVSWIFGLWVWYRIGEEEGGWVTRVEDEEDEEEAKDEEKEAAGHRFWA